MAFNVSKAEEIREKKSEGEWKVGARTGVDLFIVPSFAPQYKRAKEKIEREVRRKHKLIGRRALEPLFNHSDAFEEYLERIASEAACANWKNVFFLDGGEEKEMEFSVQNCLRAIRASDDLKADIGDLVDEVSEEEQDTREAVSGNS